MGRHSLNAELDGATQFKPAPRRFLDTAKRRGKNPAYYTRDDKGWVPTAWNVYRDEVRQAARALVALGVKPGDTVAIFGFTRPEWVIVDLAAMMVGAAPAGIYFTSSSKDAAYVINHSQCEIVLAEKKEHFDRIAQERPHLNRLRHVVMMKGEAATDPLQMTWADFLAHGEDKFDAEVERRLQSLAPSDIGTLIYTSGTTGPPKAVQLSHGALVWTADLIPPLWKVKATDRILSYLPLAHIAEQMVTIHFQTLVGNTVYFARSMAELPQHLVEVRPTIFFAVPRVFEKMAAAVQVKFAATTGVKGKLANWAVRTGETWHRKEHAGVRPGLKTSIAKAIATALVHKKAKRAMGLDQARFVTCGAAPIAEETLRFLNGLDIPIREVWGMSETCAAGTSNFPGATKVGSIGRAHPGIELKITPEGEIAVRGKCNFSGYAKDPQATANAISDGWLYTGDLGRVDEDGFVFITGRKKDIIITSGGKNIAPANVEMDLTALPLVENAVVCGDRRPYLSALVTLNADAVSQFATGHNLPHSGPALTDAVRKAIQTGIDEVNAKHSRVEHIRRFAILPEPLSIENGDLTPTMKIKRSAVIKRQEPVIDALYAEAMAE